MTQVKEMLLIISFFSGAFLSRAVRTLKTLANATGLIWERCWSYPLLRGQTVPRTVLFCRTGWCSSFHPPNFFTDEMWFGWLAWKSHSKGAAQLNRQSLQILGPQSLMAWRTIQPTFILCHKPWSRDYSWVLSHPQLCKRKLQTGHASLLLLFLIFGLHVTVICEREVSQGLLSGIAFGLHGAFLV